MNVIATGATNNSVLISNYPDDTYYFVVVANNTVGGTLSNNLMVQIVHSKPGPFTLNSPNAGTPDDDGAFTLTWSQAEGAKNYTVYQYTSMITEINGSLKVVINETYSFSIGVSDLTSGTYYYIAVAKNNYGDTNTTVLMITVKIPQGGGGETPPPGIPFGSYYILYMALGVISLVIYYKRKIKK